MGSDNTKPRQSIDSVQSTSPLIQHTVHQPPSTPHGNYDEEYTDGQTTKIEISHLIVICRLLAFIFGLIAGIGFALQGAWGIDHILLIVFTWVSTAWNAVTPINFLRKSYLRISLVLDEGGFISFRSQSDDERGDHHRRHCFRAFWVDLVLTIIIFVLNLVNSLRRWWGSSMGLNWVAFTFQVIITLLAMFPTLAKVQIRFETVDSPARGIRLPQDDAELAAGGQSMSAGA
ncbi:hypothetical protein HD806DRAFT_65786 [Xylariaceae sp. AK1471]|nr:hypothetical protein HD806DRAFT_65786 [Xylariaceae sp. AK1471]